MVYPTSAKSNLSSTTSITAAKPISPHSAFNLDDDNFEPLWASASQPFQPYSEGPSQPVENDSPVEEVEPVQPKRKYTRRSKPTKKNDKEFVEPWTIEEEIALCKAFVAKSEDSVQGNGKKRAGFWREVAERFHEEMGEDKRSYDSVNCKWKKIGIRSLTILKDQLSGKKNSSLTGVNLNDEAADSEDVEAQEVPAPIGRELAKKKGSSSGARSENLIAGDPSLVDALLSKFTMAATPFFRRGRNPPLSIYELKSVNWNWKNGNARSKENWRD
ncbi:hypothetical protein Tco_0712407 [Tanacetum coccineum]